MANPRLLMLDEPSLGLAPVMIDQLYERLQQLRKEGLTILLVEQYVSGALELADRAYVIETGTVKSEGYASELLRIPQSRDRTLLYAVKWESLKNESPDRC